MQALLLSLDEQHGGGDGGHSSGDAGASSNEAGPSGSHNGVSPGTFGAGHLSAGRLPSAAAGSRAASAAGTAHAEDAAVAAPDEDDASEAAGVADTELLAHVARLAEGAAAPQQPELSSTGTQSESPAAGSSRGDSSSRDSSACATAASPAGAVAEGAARAKIVYVCADPTHGVAAAGTGMTTSTGAADGMQQGGGGRLEAPPAGAIGSAALVDALADANGWAPAAAAPAAPAAPHIVPASSKPEEPAFAADIGSAALAQALASANGWDAAGQHESASEQSRQAAARQPAPFVSMATVHTAAHIQPAQRPAPQPAPAAAADAASQSEKAVPARGHDADGGSSSDAPSSGVASLGEAGGAALLLQPDGSTMLVLLTNSVAAAAAAAKAGLETPELDSHSIPLIEITGEV